VKNNLPCWKKFSEYLKYGKSASDFDFKCKDGDISRINARYRLAKSFKGLQLDNYSSKTIEAYSSIVKLFLVYSVFENYMNCILDDTEKRIYIKKGNLILHNSDEISEKILKIDKNKTFYETIKKFLDHTSQKREIDKFYNDEEHNIIYLISSIRHTFAHGKLTPNFNKNSIKVIKICNILSEYLLQQIANDFAKRICSG